MRIVYAQQMWYIFPIMAAERRSECENGVEVFRMERQGSLECSVLHTLVNLLNGYNGVRYEVNIEDVSFTPPPHTVGVPEEIKTYNISICTRAGMSTEDREAFARNLATAHRTLMRSCGEETDGFRSQISHERVQELAQQALVQHELLPQQVSAVA